jgi:hypothetical protein
MPDGGTRVVPAGDDERRDAERRQPRPEVVARCPAEEPLRGSERPAGPSPGRMRAIALGVPDREPTPSSTPR